MLLYYKLSGSNSYFNASNCMYQASKANTYSQGFNRACMYNDITYYVSVSSDFISGITLTTVFLVVVIIITVLIILCYSRLKRTIVAIFKRKPKKQE